MCSSASKECKIAMISHINLIVDDQTNSFVKVIESTSKIYELCNNDSQFLNMMVNTYTTIILVIDILFKLKM